MVDAKKRRATIHLLVRCLLSLAMIRSVHPLASPVGERTILAVYAGHANRYPEYQVALQAAFEESKLNVLLTDSQSASPESVDYIISSRNGPLQDFSPFSNAKAVLGLWAGVEGLADNPTLPRSIPLTRMVDPGLREGMVEYVVGHVLRYHLMTDNLWKKKQAGEWMQSDSGESMPPLARQRTVGILGLGELGGCCADALTELNFKVCGWSRSPKERIGIQCFHAESGLDAVLGQSDILVLLLPNTPETQDIINRESLARCKPGIWIINSGRGSAINEEDLLQALDSGIVAGATLDVFKTEPLPSDHGFWKHPNVLITPHIAAKTRADTASRVIAENIRRCEAGEPLLYVVDRDAGY
jgi:glyoxylate/hydroxypyruvate reductase